MRTESLPNSENNPVETSTPWDNIDDDAKTPLEERDGNTQLGVDESLGTEAPAEVDPFDPPLLAPDVPPADVPPVTPDVPPAEPDAPPATPEPSETKAPLEGLEGDTYLDVSETQPTAEPYGGANGENTGDQVNRVES